MTTNYIWKERTFKRNKPVDSKLDLDYGSLYAGSTDNPGFAAGQRWSGNARSTENSGSTNGYDIRVIKQERIGSARKTVTYREQVCVNTLRRIAHDCRLIGLNIECLNIQNPNKDALGIFDKKLYKEILSKWYPKSWRKIKALRSGIKNVGGELWKTWKVTHESNPTNTPMWIKNGNGNDCLGTFVIDDEANDNW